VARRNIIAGIDVGTTKVCTIIAEINENKSANIIGIGTSPSTGLKKGMVVDIDDTVSSIKKAVTKAERMAGVEIESAFVGIAGSHISSTNSHGVVAVTGENKEITRRDIERVIEATKIISIPPEREIIHVLPREFIVDGCKDIKYPLGMSGVRLEAETHIITGSATSIQNLIKSIHKVGLDVAGIVLQPLAASKAVLTGSDKDSGVLVDMGGGTTDIAIFRGGSVWYTSSLPVGGDHVTKDIAEWMRRNVIMTTSIADAERIKVQYGCASSEFIGEDEQIELVDSCSNETRVFSRELLCEIIQFRVDEIFSLVQQEIIKAGYNGLTPSVMVVTGGGSLLKGIPEFASRKLRMPVRVGVPDNINSILEYLDGSIYDIGEGYTQFSEDNGAIFSTGVGLVHYGSENYEDYSEQDMNEELLIKNLFDTVGKWFKNIF